MTWLWWTVYQLASIACKGACLRRLWCRFALRCVCSVALSAVPHKSFHVPTASYLPIRSLSRGDVVVATSPQNPKTTVCKRIIGLPGDRVCINPTKYPRKFKTVRRRVLRLGNMFG